MNWLIIPAGGNGKRMGALENKIFLKIAGQPILYHTLCVAEKAKIINRVIIIGKSEDLGKIRKIVARGKFKKIYQIFSAVSSRQASTWQALKALSGNGLEKIDLVGVHNAVNPLVTEEELNQVFGEAKKYGAALLMVPARDTVKIIDKDNFVETTPLRKFVWNAQTPQVGRFAWLFKAHQEAAKDHFEGTDDAMLMERMGKKVRVVPCSPENFKITFPFDLSLAEEILKRRQNGLQNRHRTG